MGNCFNRETKPVESNILWIDDNKINKYIKDVESNDGLKIQLFLKVNKAIKYMKKIKFEETKVIISDKLFSEFVITFKENILDMFIAPRIIIFSNDKNKFIANNKEYQDRKNMYYKYGGIENKIDNIRKFLNSETENIFEIEPEKIIKSNEAQLTFEYIDCKEKLFLPLFFKTLIENLSDENTKKYNDQLYNLYHEENNDLKKLLGAIKSLDNIPIEILSKFYARLYTADSSFHRNINKNLSVNKSGKYLLLIKILYDGVKLKSLPLANNNILYRGSLISNEEIETIKIYITKKLKDLPSSIVFSRAFLSFSKEKEVAERFLKFKNNNKNLSKVLFIVEKDDNIGFNLATHGDIENISFFPKEKEILFFPFSSFEIKSLREIKIGNEKGYEIRLLYLGKYLKNIENDNALILEGKKIPDSEFKKQLSEFGLIEKEKIQNLTTTILFNTYIKYQNEIKNSIIAYFEISSDKINKEIQIINSYENLEPPDIQFEGQVTPNNEKEIKENIEIKINGEKIDFAYTHKFEKEGIYKIEYLFKNNQKKINHMFSKCECLTNINFSNFNSENIINTRNMFAFCSLLKEINFSNFNTSKVTDMSEMFSDCTSLINIDLSNFNTQNVESMSGMFSYCSSLINLDLSNFNTQNVYSMSDMFSYCSALENLNLSNFNTQNVVGMDEMFSGCEALKNLDLTNFKTNNKKEILKMLKDCKSLKKENVITKDVEILNGFK